MTEVIEQTEHVYDMPYDHHNNLIGLRADYWDCDPDTGYCDCFTIYEDGEILGFV